MSKHTPGPWMAERNFMASPHRCTGRIFGKVVHVASAHSVQGGDANAILIAAAPDLLYQLKQVESQLSRGEPFPPAAIVAIRAAIAKAEGGAE